MAICGGRVNVTTEKDTEQGRLSIISHLESLLIVFALILSCIAQSRSWTTLLIQNKPSLLDGSKSGCCHFQLFVDQSTLLWDLPFRSLNQRHKGRNTLKHLIIFTSVTDSITSLKQITVTICCHWEAAVFILQCLWIRKFLNFGGPEILSHYGYNCTYRTKRLKKSRVIYWTCFLQKEVSLKWLVDNSKLS